MPSIVAEAQAALKAKFTDETDVLLQSVAVDLVVSDYLNAEPSEETASKVAARVLAFTRSLSADQFRQFADESVIKSTE